MRDNITKATYRHFILLRLILFTVGMATLILRRYIIPRSAFKMANGVKAKLLIREKDKVLLVRNSLEPTIWTLPGGRVEKNEIPRQAAVRELLEELGIDVKSTSLRHVGVLRSGETGMYHDYEIFAMIFSFSTPIHLSMEILEARWFDVRQIPENANLVHFPLVANYLDADKQNLSDNFSS